MVEMSLHVGPWLIELKMVVLRGAPGNGGVPREPACLL